MTFDELLNSIEIKPCKEKRQREADYLEVVVAKTALEPVISALGDYFGAPLKPEGQKPTAAAQKHSEPYGGIYAGQTMYFRDGGTGPEMALLWPWGSEPLVTLKIIRGGA